MNKSLSLLIAGLISIMLIVVSCVKDEQKFISPAFVFKHTINDTVLQTGVMKYTNLAGNHYQVDELQYFISEITLKTADGQLIKIESDSAVHYVDLDVPASLTWNPKDMIPVGEYTSISFVFGINETKNKTGLFVNPPQRDMFWPDMMGGGYHYMKMNGKWNAEGNIITPFNFHLGIGMNMDGTIFYQNYFEVTVPLNIRTGTIMNEFDITMNIEKWFETPNVWDWNVIGGQIMMNQNAMHKACENGANVFTVTYNGGFID